VLVLYLVQVGLTTTQVGLLLTFTLLGDTAISLWLTTQADHLGRRRMLLLGAALMVVAGIVFAFTSNYLLLIIAATIGVISPSGNEVGPFLSVEQASLTQLFPAERRTQVFAWYNLVGSFTTATGALLGGALAALLAAAWLPVALAQPRASMAWAAAQPLGERALQFAANLGLGLPADPGAARLLAPFALAVLGFALLLGRGRARVPAAAPLLLGLALLAPLVLWSGAALLPDRTALLLLPLVALVLAESGPLLSAVAGLTGPAVLVASFPGLLRTTPGAELAKALEPRVKAGSRVVAAELWGPELDYRLARAGLPGRVALYPSDVARHPGWYDEGDVDVARLATEAASAVSGADARTHFVFSPLTRAGRALASALVPRGGRRAASAGQLEVWVIPRATPNPEGAAP